MKRHPLLATTVCLLALGLTPSCSTEVRGQLMLVLQTDMSLPKDIDRIRIEATRTDTGRVIYQQDFVKLGGAESIKLPGTLPFSASSNPADSIRIRVIASRGSDESVRVLREVVSTVPQDRVASLPLTLEFLCNGEVEVEYDANGKARRDESGNVIVKSTCPDGQTCVSGSCKLAEVAAEELPDYKEEEVFGGGSGEGDGVCFDTAQCFDDATNVELDLASFASDPSRCLALVTGDVNIALRTQGGGICGAAGCFVALDADSDAGWKKIEAGGTIELPTSVCAKVQSGEIAGVVAAPVGTATCQLKRAAVPTCGPWSSAGADAYTPPDPLDPTVVVVGQASPSSLALAYDTLYWISRGTFDENGNSNGDGSVKAVSIEGGEPATLAEKQPLLGMLALDVNRQFALWTSTESVVDPATMAVRRSGRLLWAPFLTLGKAVPVGEPLLLLDPDSQPEGVAVQSGTVYWTDRISQKAHNMGTIVDGDVLAADGAPADLPSPDPAGVSPGAIAASNDTVCWLYTGKLGASDGVVACARSGMTTAVATGQSTPRAIALRTDESGAATAVYWANFDAAAADPGAPGGGGIFKVDILGGSFGALQKIAAEDYPGGLAADPDGASLCWTSRSRGTVMALRPQDPEPVVLVEGQSNPGAVVASSDAIYWVNEGKNTGVDLDGAIMKVAKPTPAN